MFVSRVVRYSVNKPSLARKNFLSMRITRLSDNSELEGFYLFFPNRFFFKQKVGYGLKKIEMYSRLDKHAWKSCQACV